MENTIQMVEGNPDWKARVVYGDTDSLFVLLPGRTKEDAFKIGAEIASQATARNPPPVTLKMEKVALHDSTHDFTQLTYFKLSLWIIYHPNFPESRWLI